MAERKRGPRTERPTTPFDNAVGTFNRTLNSWPFFNPGSIRDALNQVENVGITTKIHPSQMYDQLNKLANQAATAATARKKIEAAGEFQGKADTYLAASEKFSDQDLVRAMTSPLPPADAMKGPKA